MESILETMKILKRRCNSKFWKDKSALNELRKCFGNAPEDMVLTPPVYFDHGDRVFFGKHFYANIDLTILDENKVILEITYLLHRM